MTLLVGSIFHMTCKIVSEMTYNVSMGTLNPTILYYTIRLADKFFIFLVKHNVMMFILNVFRTRRHS